MFGLIAGAHIEILHPKVCIDISHKNFIITRKADGVSSSLYLLEFNTKFGQKTVGNTDINSIILKLCGT